jgi:hypothetical protein
MGNDHHTLKPKVIRKHAGPTTKKSLFTNAHADTTATTTTWQKENPKAVIVKILRRATAPAMTTTTIPVKIRQSPKHNIITRCPTILIMVLIPTRP